MEIKGINIYRGSNIYSYCPVIRMELDIGQYSNISTSEIDGFNEKLLEYMPSLARHCCSRGYEGGFAERLKEGTYLGHVVEHIILELQHLSGIKVNFGKTRKTERERHYFIIFSYKEERPALLAAEKAVEIVEAVLNKDEINLEPIINRIKKAAAKTLPGPSTASIIEAAQRRKIPVIRLDPETSFVQLGYGIKQRRIRGSITDYTSCVAVDIASDKWLTRRMLKSEGLPVPVGRLFEKSSGCYEFADELGVPIVAKPYNQNQGKGVSVNLVRKEDIEKAFLLAQKYSEKVIVEEKISGNDYRFLIVGGKMVACAMRQPPQIEGDGKHTVKELIEIANQNPKRGYGHEKPLTKIKVDGAVNILLKEQGYSLDSVPSEGENIQLRKNGNLSTGGTSTDVTEQVHPRNIYFARRAAEIVGLDVAGVDIVAQDITEPLDDGNGAIIEVNASPGLRMHHYPQSGKSRDAGEAVVDHLFKNRKDDARIPILSATGTNGKTTTVRLISDMLKRTGKIVGMTTTDGIFVGDRCVERGDMTGPQSARSILSHNEVEAAVLETARGGILREGLGYDYADVGLVTNISADHLEQQGVRDLKELADVKSLIVEMVWDNGWAVLNADDPYTVKMADNTRAKVIFFSRREDNVIIKKHLKTGGRAVYLRQNKIFLNDSNNEQKVADIKDIPLTINGYAGHNIENCLAASAGAWGLGIASNYIAESLKNFKTNPGRFEIFKEGGFITIIDYGHNPAGFRAVLMAAEKLKHMRLIGVVGVPGDRSNELIIEAGRIAGWGFDQLIIKEDSITRGRQRGETAELLEKGALQTKMINKNNIEIILSEKNAVKRAAELAQKGDLLIIFFEKEPEILKKILLSSVKSADEKKTSYFTLSSKGG